MTGSVEDFELAASPSQQLARGRGRLGNRIYRKFENNSKNQYLLSIPIVCRLVTLLLTLPSRSHVSHAHAYKIPVTALEVHVTMYRCTFSRIPLDSVISF